MCVSERHRSGRTGRCLGVAVAGAMLVCPSAEGASRSVFGGSTEDDAPIVLVSDGPRKHLRAVVITAVSRCADGRVVVNHGEFTPGASRLGFTSSPTGLVMSRNAGGRFAGRHVDVPAPGDDARGTLELSGRLGKAGATGTMTVSWELIDPSGAVTTTCTTGAISWNAPRRQGTVYGGVTSQDEPVVVRLNRRRTRVEHFRIGWRAELCNPSGLFRGIDDLVRFPIGRTSKFGDRFTSTEPTSSGLVTTDYDLKGRVKPRVSTGTFQAHVVSASDTAFECDTGVVKWRAATG